MKRISCIERYHSGKVIKVNTYGHTGKNLEDITETERGLRKQIVYTRPAVLGNIVRPYSIMQI